MPAWLDLDWHRMFVPHVPILETVIRGSIMYLAMFVLLRCFRRQTGSIGPADLLVLLLIADASQNGMADEYKSITEGLVLVCTIMGWEYVIDRISYSVPAIGGLIEREPLTLIRNGELIQKNLESEYLSKDDLLSQLRQKGVEDPAEVAYCCLEGDGHISVITFDRRSEMSQNVRGDANGR
jgi:uncharacterized membrane protein YcaP (DUF421 family)